MEIKHIAYPSIGQFDEVIRQVRVNHDYKGKDENGDVIYLHDSPYPTIKFVGTEKLHGTNSNLTLWADGTKVYQSRERILSLTADNARFFALNSIKNTDFLFDGIEFKEYIAVYGEWCGGSIKKGVGLNQLPNIFVIFRVKVDGQWIDKVYENDAEQGIYDIRNFKKWEINIDFNNPKMQQNDIVDMTLTVEEASPFAIALGAVPEKGLIGEGIVWESEDFKYKFKSKGLKHQGAGKTKAINLVDTAVLETINEFVELAVPEWRLEQGISWLKENNKPVDKSSTADYLRWLFNDVLKEHQETILKNNIDVKKISGPISNKGREYFFKEIYNQI